MGRARKISSIVLLAVAASALVQPASAATCAELSAALDRAVSARSLTDAKQSEKAIFQAGSDCIDDRQGARAKRAALEVVLATDPEGPLRTDADREAALSDASTRSDSWRASRALADFQVQRQRFRDAAANYDLAIERALQFDRLSDKDRKDLLEKAAAAKLLASDDREGSASVPLKLSARATNGTVGGIFSPGLLRGTTPVAVPLPIQFTTGSSQLTPTGEQAAEELVKALREQGVTRATLVGHTDTRGGADYNMRLSSQRLDTVRAYLRKNGIGFDLVLVPKGLSEPFDVRALPYQPTQEQVWALDRRVEWVRPPTGE